MKTAITTDSSSGITQAEAAELGIQVAPVPLLIDGETFYEDKTITQAQFYEKLKTAEQVSTSAPIPAQVDEMWTELLKTYDNVIYIPISSGLSETCHVLESMANTEEKFKGKVFVVDNQRVSITQRQSVLDALKLAKEGKSGQEIYDWLTKTKLVSSIYIMVNTLKYLKRSGRLTPAAAMIGTILKIKPVLQIQGFKLDSFAKARKVSEAKDIMLNAVKNDLETRFAEEVKAGKMTLAVAHTDNFEEAENFKQEIIAKFPNIEFTSICPLSLSVASHIGPGSLAVACIVKY